MQSYRLSKALFELYPPAKKAGLKDERLLREHYRLRPEEIDAVLRADLIKLYELGANPYLIRFAFRDKYPY